MMVIALGVVIGEKSKSVNGGEKKGDEDGKID